MVYTLIDHTNDIKMFKTRVDKELQVSSFPANF